MNASYELHSLLRVSLVEFVACEQRKGLQNSGGVPHFLIKRQSLEAV
jgi:hypothetical protein